MQAALCARTNASSPHRVALWRHFYRFMGEVHEHLRDLGERQNPLVDVAEGIAQCCRVLCLDEFLVNDIGDAMILADLLEALFARVVTLATTSNTAPASSLPTRCNSPSIAKIQPSASYNWSMNSTTATSS